MAAPKQVEEIGVAGSQEEAAKRDPFAAQAKDPCRNAVDQSVAETAPDNQVAHAEVPGGFPYKQAATSTHAHCLRAPGGSDVDQNWCYARPVAHGR